MRPAAKAFALKISEAADLYVAVSHTTVATARRPGGSSPSVPTAVSPVHVDP
jgi:hypothetical protein